MQSIARMLPALGSIICVFLLVGGQHALAADKSLDVREAKLTGERPNKDGPPTEVRLGIFVFDVDSIDDARQRFSVDMLLHVTWKDERLALRHSQRKGLIRTVPRETVWHPRGLIINARGLSTSLPATVDIDDEGNVQFIQRGTGELAADLKFQRFPFDVQLLPIDVVSYAQPEDQITFALDSEILGDDGSFSVEGWQLTLLEPKLGQYQMPGLNKPRARATFVIGAERETVYYLLTLFIPMALIILMAWSVFWLPPDIIPARVGISTASIFSFVAFGFSVRARLPEVSYITPADFFVTGCTLLVFLALGIVVWGSRLANSERLDQALRISAVARWLYLLLFALMCISAYNFG
jgi:hypothetical protein